TSARTDSRPGRSARLALGKGRLADRVGQALRAFGVDHGEDLLVPRLQGLRVGDGPDALPDRRIDRAHAPRQDLDDGLGPRLRLAPRLALVEDLLVQRARH